MCALLCGGLRACVFKLLISFVQKLGDNLVAHWIDRDHTAAEFGLRSAAASVPERLGVRGGRCHGRRKSAMFTCAVEKSLHTMMVNTGKRPRG